jgi:murein DD-endopeptidase MepM/ murein hydrolase activator NlpD
VVYVRPDFGYVEIKHDKKLVTGVKYGLNQDKPLDGNLIEDGKPAWYSGYMHMADIRVKVGDEVEAGKTLGIISNVIKDGSVPVHLHFAVYDRDGYSFSPYFLPNNPANKITFQDIVYGGYNAEEKFKVGSFYVQADQDKFTNEKTDTSQGGVRYADYRNNK